MGSLRVASLFTGCGGMDMGIAGGFTFLGKHYRKNPVNFVFANDFEKTACEIFSANFDHSILCGDIKKVNTSEIPDHDILLGGFPCQSFSIVAQNPPRLGYNSETGKLFFEMVRILKGKKPMCFVAENVKGILSADKGRTFRLILDEFNKAGYSVDYRLLNSADFGVPQRRERVFIIGFRKDLGITPTFPKNTLKEQTPLRTVLMPHGAVDKKYYFSQKAVLGMLRAKEKMNKGRAQDEDLPCATVTAHLAKYSLNSVDPVLPVGRKYRRFTPREVARIQSFPDSFKLVNSENRQYRALGNAVPPVLMWHVSKNIVDLLLKIKKGRGKIIEPMVVH
ncbi:DNA (cytosine-5-)-methyltransferase [Candidatus Nitrosotenuis uzonensis]|uniref:DNA (cytosine-5-)-methyltransferase n=1 Tax=Candidatus Nitrosotenuis uzonensis TaxID=1407055 RepID=A0A812EW22_9ARCH|nr:DNA (cytosine-5-)-methyltransferase [Candidatus Nitrosotenuis uzonensis]CAE6485812.1 Cytosine-specific methyltransferase [Candidatus Nitrosotenuis uzonensis]